MKISFRNAFGIQVNIFFDKKKVRETIFFVIVTAAMRLMIYSSDPIDYR